jgi:hypothetical protein
MDEPVERFQPTSGRITGMLAVAVGLTGLLLAWVDREQSYALAVALAATFFAVLAWTALLRPNVTVTPSTLVLRNMLDTVFIPLVAIEDLVVRHSLVVRADGRKYVSPAIGKSWRSMARPRPGQPPPQNLTPEQALARSYADFVETRIRHLSDEARARAGVARGSVEQPAGASGVRREPAWLEIGALAASLVGFVAVVVLA